MAKSLIDGIREVFRTEHYAYRTEETYLKWIKRFIARNHNRHPRELGANEIQEFLTHIAVDRFVSASAQNQALSAILFLYKKVLGIDLPWMNDIVRAKRPVRVPVVKTRPEVTKVLACLHGKHWLMANILYGSGLRLMECLRLRIQDIDFDYLQITVRGGKGNRNRRAALSRGWQYLFPSSRYAYIRHNQGMRRHHSHSSGLSRAVKAAVEESGINKRATSHTFRHSFATRSIYRINVPTNSLTESIS